MRICGKKEHEYFNMMRPQHPNLQYSSLVSVLVQYLKGISEKGRIASNRKHKEIQRSLTQTDSVLIFA